MVKSKSSKVGDWVIALICTLLMLACLLPLLNIAARSFSSSMALVKNEVYLLPVDFNLDAYKLVFNDSKYTNSLVWTAALTVMSTVLSMVMTILCAYPFVYSNLKGRKIFNLFIVFTMYFSAGTIPMYLLLTNLKMLDHPAVLMIPYCLSVFNMLIMRSFFYDLPESLRESAELDGAGPFTTLVNIYVPLSTPVIATLALFYAVGRWNGYSDALMFMKDRKYYPIQLLLYNILQSAIAIDTPGGQETTPGVSETLKAATVMVATVPILMVYPWLQRYFIAGVTLGAVKE